MEPSFQIPAPRCIHRALLAAGMLCLLAGCSSPQGSTLDEFTRWQDSTRARAQAGALAWSDFYRQSFDRLTALPPSLQQDTQLEHTVLMLSTARKFESNELSAQQFAAQQQAFESQLQARLR